ncbi:GNAT family N-acetyltransferase [Roseibium sp.]|uniref:GNAT family N-acetyltransferase n=1 Tax=Roseibium sp. TaxID=1936156 RepID=UPI003D09BFE6
MSGPELELNGYTDIPDGKVAFVVTFLEMRERPEQPLAPPRQDVRLERWSEPKAEDYRKLFREVGEDWLWFARLAASDRDLEALLAEPTRENYRPIRDGKPVGTLELDFSNPAEPEVAYFGLTPDAIGGGMGRWLMGQAVEMAWARPETRRLWLHTCTGDSPQAIHFYQSCGFKAYKRSIEVSDDPRFSGLYPVDKAQHVPLIG